MEEEHGKELKGRGLETMGWRYGHSPSRPGPLGFRSLRWFRGAQQGI